MIFTDEKIEVTGAMMEAAGLTRYGEYGVPIDPKNAAKGLRWKTLFKLQDADYDAIEEYFLNRA